MADKQKRLRTANNKLKSKEIEKPTFSSTFLKRTLKEELIFNRVMKYRVKKWIIRIFWKMMKLKY